MASNIVQLDAGDRVLITRLDYLGDVVLSLPLVDAIRSRYPGVTLDYLSRRPGADLLAGDERFERVFVQERGMASGLRLVRMLRRRSYRAVIDLYTNPRSAWLSRFSGAPVRIGGDRRGRRRLYTHPMTVPPEVRDATAFHLWYGRPLGIEGTPGKPSLKVQDVDRRLADRALDAIGVGDGRPLVGIHPGGKWAVKRWPEDSFVALARRLAESHGVTVVVFSGPGEEAYTRAVCANTPQAVALPVLGVRTVAAAVERMRAFVACDGGIMHVAAAVGTPTVGIFGSAEPQVWFPYHRFGPFAAAYNELECRPCHQHRCPLGHTDCLRALSVDDVMRTLETVMKAHEIGGAGRVDRA